MTTAELFARLAREPYLMRVDEILALTDTQVFELYFRKLDDGKGDNSRSDDGGGDGDSGPAPAEALAGLFGPPSANPFL